MNWLRRNKKVLLPPLVVFIVLFVWLLFSGNGGGFDYGLMR